MLKNINDSVKGPLFSGHHVQKKLWKYKHENHTSETQVRRC